MMNELPLRPGGIELTQRALRLCPFSKHEMILDIGCGHGQSVDFMRHLGFKAYGLDIDQKYCAPNKSLCADALHLPFARQSLGGIVSECVLSLMPDTHAALEHWHAICQPNAYLLLHDVFAKTQGTQGLNRRELKRSLKKIGWTVLHVEDCAYYLIPYAAQLLWHDQACDTLDHWKNSTYELWIAQKN